MQKQKLYYIVIMQGAVERANAGIRLQEKEGEWDGEKREAFR